MLALWALRGRNAAREACARGAQLGVPDWPVWPSGRELGLLAGVAVSSFLGQYTLSRSFQLLAASHASAVNTLQARCAVVVPNYKELACLKSAHSACMNPSQYGRTGQGLGAVLFKPGAGHALCCPRGMSA